jgi:hypothetical protein
MTVQDGDTLKSYFNKGDIPTESNYIDLIDTIIGGVEKYGNSILLYHASGADLTDYPLTDDGLFQALSEASPGDAITVPAVTLVGNQTVPAGVILIGMGMSTIFTGEITCNGYLLNLVCTSGVTYGDDGSSEIFNSAGDLLVFGNFAIGLDPTDEIKQKHTIASDGDAATLYVQKGYAGEPIVVAYTASGGSADPDHLYILDEVIGSASADGSGVPTPYVYCVINPNQLPPGFVISGIKVRMYLRQNTQGTDKTMDANVLFMDLNDNPLSEDKALAGYLPPQYDWREYGGPNDGWTATFDAEDVNAGTVKLAARWYRNPSGILWVWVEFDYLEITFYGTGSLEYVAGVDQSEGVWAVEPGDTLTGEGLQFHGDTGTLDLPAEDPNPPLLVNSPILVVNLNADLLDGVEASGFLSSQTKLDDLASPDDNTDLDSTVEQHGLLPKLSGVSTEALLGDGTWGGIEAGASALADLTDVDVSSPEDGQALIYDLNSELWIPGDVSAGEGNGVSGVGETLYVKKLIYDLTLDADTSAFDITGIPQDYDHLELLIDGRTDETATASDLLLTFNNDTTDANYYSNHYLYNNGNTQHGYDGAGRWSMRITGANAPSNMFGQASSMIQNYASTAKNKESVAHYFTQTGAATVTSGFIEVAWFSTAAINRITLSIYTGGKKFKAGSRCQLLAWKNKLVTAGQLSAFVGTQIHKTTVSAGGLASIDITAIPAGYDYLELLFNGKSDRAGGADGIKFVFNSDTNSANYDNLYIYYGYADGHNQVAAHDSNFFDTTGASGVTSSGRCVLPGYDSATIPKSLTVETLIDHGSGSEYKVLRRGRWSGTAAISRITLSMYFGSNFVEGSTIILVGYKNTLVAGRHEIQWNTDAVEAEPSLNFEGEGVELIDDSGVSTTVKISGLYPHFASIWASYFRRAAGSWDWTSGEIATRHFLYSAAWYQYPSANGDAGEISVLLDSGSYDFAVSGATQFNLGKLDWYIDGSLAISGQDWYSATNIDAVTKANTITISTAGRHTVKWVVNGKNNSSSDYYIMLTEIGFNKQVVYTQ